MRLPTQRTALWRGPSGSHLPMDRNGGVLPSQETCKECLSNCKKKNNPFKRAFCVFQCQRNVCSTQP